MTVAFVESDRIVFCDGKDLREEERDDSKEQVKNVRCVWCSSQSVGYFEYQKGTVADILKTNVSDPAWYEEVLEADEKQKTVKANVYYTETSNVFPIIAQKPISLTPLFYVLKKIAEEKLSPEKKKVVGCFFGRKNSFVFMSLSREGKVEKFERKELPKGKIQELIEARSEELDFYVVGITISEADFYRLAASKYAHLLTRESTFLNDELKEVFYDVDEEKRLIKSIAFAGGLLLASSVFYVGSSAYLHFLTQKLKQENRKVSQLRREILKEQQKKLYSYAKAHSIDARKFPLPFREEFLVQFTTEGSRGETVFDIPTDVLSPEEEKAVITKAVKSKCKVKKLEKILRLTCPVREK